MMRPLIDRRLALALTGAVLLCAAGAALVAASRHVSADANRQLLAARAERAQAHERLAGIARDEREMTQRLEVYRKLAALNILGAERRLDWTESIARIRERRRLPELRYEIAPRRPLQSIAGAPGRVESFASRMKLELGLLHEGDLLGFLGDLRASGNAYYAVNQCAIARAAAATVAAVLAPRLRATCEIDLITLQDGGSRT